MKKILTTILLFAVSVVYAFSASNTSNEAMKLLDKAAAKVNLKSGATANFTISSDKIGKQSGTIQIKGTKFQASTPSAIVWFNGKTQWTYLKKNEEVNVSTPSAAQQSAMNPYTFLNIYKKGYNLSVEKSASGKQVHLVAQNKQASIKEMFILIDSANNIKQVKLKQGNNWLTISISNMKAKSISDSAFTFNAKDYPQAEVIDLR